MMLMHNSKLRAGLVIGILAVPVAAAASHGKVGLWEVTTQTSMPNMASTMTPEQAARMQAMGVHMPNNRTLTTQHCMTAAEVAADGPPPMRSNKYCTMSNMKYGAHSFTSDATCTGEMEGQGQVSVSFPSDEQYSGTFAFTGSAHGHQMNVTNSFEGRWISADCGSVK